MPNSVWPHGQQPIRLLCLCDSFSKNTGVGCHFLLHFNEQELPNCLIKQYYGPIVFSQSSVWTFLEIGPFRSYLQLNEILSVAPNQSGQVSLQEEEETTESFLSSCTQRKGHVETNKKTGIYKAREGRKRDLSRSQVCQLLILGF